MQKYIRRETIVTAEQYIHGINLPKNARACVGTHGHIILKQDGSESVLENEDWVITHKNGNQEIKENSKFIEEFEIYKKDAFTYLRALYFLTVDFISGLDSTKCVREIYMTSETEEEARIDAFQRFSNLQAQEHMDITKCWLSVSFPTGITKIIEVLKDDEVKK